MDGWIKLHRKLLEWEWYDDTNVVRVFLHLLLTANYEPKKWHGLTIERGQLLTSVANLAAQVHLSAMQIRTVLDKLKTTNEITIKTTNKNTLITICKYDKYQYIDDTEQQTKQQTTKQTGNNQITTTKEIKNIKNDKNNIYTDENFENALFENEMENNPLLTDTAEPLKRKKVAPKKEKYGEFKNVLLSVQEAEKLKSLYGADAANIVQNFSELKEMKGYKYKSDFMAIKKWGANAYYEQIKKQTNGNNAASIERISEASDAWLEYERQLRAKYAQQSANN